MPFNMAMKQPSTRIIGLEANHRIAVALTATVSRFAGTAGKFLPWPVYLPFPLAARSQTGIDAREDGKDG
jgi:hypothetical protein